MYLRNVRRGRLGVRIGITCSFDAEEERYYLRKHYVRKVIEAGGVPVILPSTADPSVIEVYQTTCHGLLLAGGGDVDPVQWGEEPHPELGPVDPERDEFELSLVRWAQKEDIPVLGICRGAQVINVAFGGSLVQHLTAEICHFQKAPPNHPFHDILLVKGTKLHGILGLEKLRVNSYHHQAVREPGRGLVVSATARDGTVEAVESLSNRFIVGVQWHPELMTDEASASLFQALVDAAGRRIQNEE